MARFGIIDKAFEEKCKAKEAELVRDRWESLIETHEIDEVFEDLQFQIQSGYLKQKAKVLSYDFCKS